MGDIFLRIRDRLRFLPSIEDIQDMLPESTGRLPLEIESQLSQILSSLNPDNPDINQQLDLFLEMIKQYGHSLHPYISSFDISNLISMLQIPELNELVLSILWSCTLFSQDIIGYFLEADSFIPRLCDIFFAENTTNQILVLKLIYSCTKYNQEVTNSLIEADFFNHLIPYCQDSNLDMISLFTVILNNCSLSHNFFHAAFPLMKHILLRSNQPNDDISTILYLLSMAINEFGTNNPIGLFLCQDYLSNLTAFIAESDNIQLISASLAIFIAFLSNDPQIICAIFSSNIIQSTIKHLFAMEDPNPVVDLDSLNDLADEIIAFLNIVLDVSKCDEELISTFVDIIAQSDLITYCGLCNFSIRSHLIIIILTSLVFDTSNRYEVSLLSKDFVSIVLGVFESSDKINQKRICELINSILLANRKNTEFCEMVISLWSINDTCTNFCPEIMTEELCFDE